MKKGACMCGFGSCPKNLIGWLELQGPGQGPSIEIQTSTSTLFRTCTETSFRKLVSVHVAETTFHNNSTETRKLSLRQKSCLETSFLSLRQLSCLCRNRNIVSETTFPSQRQCFCLQKQTNLSQRQLFGLRDKFLVSVDLLWTIVSATCTETGFRKLVSVHVLKNVFVDVWISLLGPCPGPCSSNQPMRFLAHDPQPLMQATFFHLDSSLCFMYRNLSKLDKATFQAHFLPPLLAVTVDTHMPQLSSL